MRGEVSKLTDRVASGEESVSLLADRVAALEQARDRQREATVMLQLHLEDVEDRSHRNNLRLRGIPEPADMEDVGAKVTDIFRVVLEDPEAQIVLDRAHRALGPRPAEQDKPRDVICRLHRYGQKEDILRRAWDLGDIEVDGAQVRIMPDLSRATLRRRAMLRPILDLARQTGHTYCWGYPLAVTFRKDNTAFSLQSAADLPALFRFLGTEPIQVPDWLQFIPRQIGQSGAAANRGPQVQRPQRGRRRRHSSRGGAGHE